MTRSAPVAHRWLWWWSTAPHNRGFEARRALDRTGIDTVQLLLRS